LSYPFSKALNWDEFIRLMKTLDVLFKTETLEGPNGKPLKITYFENKVDGEHLTHVVDIADRSQMLLPAMVLGICRPLHIHPKLFGMDLN
jgi:hypothetical protein